MSKFILKTALITASVILAAALLLYGALALFSPSVLSSFYEEAGFDSAALKYAEMQYGKTKSSEDLKRLVDLLCFKKAGEKEYLKLAEYGTSYCDGEFFAEYAKKTDNGIDYFKLVTSRVCSAIYYSGNGNEAIKKANEYFLATPNGEEAYSGSALRAIVLRGAEKNDVEFLKNALVALENAGKNNLSEADASLLLIDKENVKKIVS